MAAYLREKGKDFETTHSPMYTVGCAFLLCHTPTFSLLWPLLPSPPPASLTSDHHGGTGLCSFLNLPGIFPLGACSLDAHITSTLLFFGLYSKCVFSCSLVSDSFMTPWTVAHQTPLSMGFPKQEYWVCCHFLLQGIFPTQGLNALPGGFFIIEPFGKPRDQTCLFYISCIGMCVLYH